MADLLAHPFRFHRGRAVTVEQDSDADYAQQLAVAITTRRGERVLVPDYGLTDPVGRGISEGELQAHADLFGPPVTIDQVAATPLDDRRTDVTVEWRRDEVEGVAADDEPEDVP